MIQVVGVRFKRAGKIYYFDPKQLELHKDDNVIVETARGLEYGEVVIADKTIKEDEVVSPMKPVIRKATEKDDQIYARNKEKEEEALEICKEKIIKHKLDMKLTDVEYTFDNNKVIFYFTADGRVDFRELVKDLASVFKIRIELRQIGVRDEAKMLGGLGPCGIPMCCSKWLGEFHPVSIKMAKEQNLSLNPSKISGICGRLLCCLKYEQDFYEEVNDRLPSYGQRVQTDEGEGHVFKVNVLRETITVKLDGEDAVLKEYKLDEVKVQKKGSCCQGDCSKNSNQKKPKNASKPQNQSNKENGQNTSKQQNKKSASREEKSDSQEESKNQQESKNTKEQGDGKAPENKKDKKQKSGKKPYPSTNKGKSRNKNKNRSKNKPQQKDQSNDTKKDQEK